MPASTHATNSSRSAPGREVVRDIVPVSEDLVEEIEVDGATQDRGASEQRPPGPIQAVDAAREQRLESIRQLLGRPVLHGDAASSRAKSGLPAARSTIASRSASESGAPPAASRASAHDRIRIKGAEIDPRWLRTGERPRARALEGEDEPGARRLSTQRERRGAPRMPRPPSGGPRGPGRRGRAMPPRAGRPSRRGGGRGGRPERGRPRPGLGRRSAPKGIARSGSHGPQRRERGRRPTPTDARRPPPDRRPRGSRRARAGRPSEPPYGVACVGRGEAGDERDRPPGRPAAPGPVGTSRCRPRRRSSTSARRLGRAGKGLPESREFVIASGQRQPRRRATATPDLALRPDTGRRARVCPSG